MSECRDVDYAVAAAGCVNVQRLLLVVAADVQWLRGAEEFVGIAIFGRNRSLTENFATSLCCQVSDPCQSWRREVTRVVMLVLEPSERRVHNGTFERVLLPAMGT